MILGHGDDIYSQHKEIQINFSSNVDTHQDLSALRAHLIEHIHCIHSYPEPDAHSLKELLAHKNEVESCCIGITNGATEAIYLIAQAFKKSHTAILIPTFSEYEDASVLNNHSIRYIETIKDIKANDQLVWICNPNNPTGQIIEKHILETCIQAHPNTVFIIDQSYEYFSHNEVFSMKESTRYSNLIILHSMTKHFAIPGLRLGYISGERSLVAQIMTYRMPWSVNQLAIEAGKFLETKYNNLVDIELHLKNAKLLQSKLKTIQGLEVLPTETHFFLCKLKDNLRTAKELKEFLIDHYGFLIRDASNFKGLTPQHFRIASQTEYDNNRLIEALQAWI